MNIDKLASRNGILMKKDLRVLSLFSGCGGMDLGFEGNFKVPSKSINPEIHPEWKNDTGKDKWITLPATRFKTIFANDIFPAARAAWVSFFKNYGHSEKHFHLESIVDLVKKQESGSVVFPEADVVIGGFPCQDFSVAGKRHGFYSDKDHHGKPLNGLDCPTEENRGKLYMWMRRVIEFVKPKVFVAENVKGLVSLADAKKIIEADFSNIDSGYIVVDAQVLYAPMYGIPQSRERVIFIGFRRDILTEDAVKSLLARNINCEFNPYPKQTHGSHEGPSFHENALLPYVSVGDYILDLPEPDNSNDLSQQSYSKAKWYGKHCQGQAEVDLGGVGPTIRAEHHGNIEFRRLFLEHGGKYKDEIKSGLKERRLTVRECARLQTFPDNFEFVREATDGKEYKISASEGYKLVGNAVPPLLAFHIAWRLQELWPNIIKQ
mgnify:CR=1 FL=1